MYVINSSNNGYIFFRLYIVVDVENVIKERGEK